MNITIVGLGVVGTSVGLSLKHVSQDLQITGHDPDSDRSKRARKLGGIDKSHWNLLSACDDADVIVLDLPLPEVEKTLTALRGQLKEGAVIIDLCAVKAPVMAMAQELVTGSVHYIGGHLVSPSLAPGAEPSAELLDAATFYLAAGPKTSPEAMAMATHLAEAVGAKPHYIDAEEHDAVIAATAQLPAVVALAVVTAIRSESGWRDRAHCGTAEFGGMCDLVDMLSEASVGSLVSNAATLVPWLDRFSTQIAELRRLLVAGNAQALEQALRDSLETCGEWSRGGAPADDKIEPPVTGIRSMLLGGLGRKSPDRSAQR